MRICVLYFGLDVNLSVLFGWGFYVKVQMNVFIKKWNLMFIFWSFVVKWIWVFCCKIGCLYWKVGIFLILLLMDMILVILIWNLFVCSIVVFRVMDCGLILLSWRKKSWEMYLLLFFGICKGYRMGFMKFGQLFSVLGYKIQVF